MTQLHTRGKTVVLVSVLAVAQLAMARRASAKESSSPSPKAHALTIASLPINFEPNRGQAPWPARFVARAGSVQIDFDSHGFDLWLAGDRGNRTRINVSFVDARNDASLTASDEQASQTNYLLGQDPSRWRTHIPNFGRVRYGNLYSGIDAVFYGTGQQLEHDFVVAPGADYRLIRLRFEGARELSLDADGNLRLALDDGELSLHAPVMYQDSTHGRQSREGRFVLLRKNEIGFEIGDYDRSQPLLIDPTLNYATYLADLSVNVDAIAADSSGNTYVTGLDWSGSYPLTPGAFQSACPSCPGEPVIFITKLNIGGSAQVFSTYLGGSGYNQSSGVAADTQGNTIVVGWTQSQDFPLKNPISNGTFNPGNNGTFGFVSSLSPDGSSLNYSSVLGGAGSQGGPTTYTNAVAVDASGNAYISGTTDSPFYPVTAGALNSGTPAYPEKIVYVSKVSPAGSLVFSGLLGDVSIQGGGDGPIGVMGIKVDASGNAYIAGDAGSLWPTTSGAYEPKFPSSTSTSNKAPFVAKVSADGSTLLYSTFLGVDATVAGIALDSNGDAFLAGSYAPSDFPTTPNAYQQTLASGQVAPFLCELNPSGSELVYSTFFYGTPIFTIVSGVALDASDNIWLTGFTEDTQFPLVHPLLATFGITLTGNEAGFLSEFNPAGTSLLFSTYFAGRASAANIAGLAFDASGNVYIAGTVGDDLYTTPGVFLESVTPPPQYVQYTYGFVASINPAAAAPAVCVANPGYGGVIFGAVPVGTTSSQSVTIQNCGTQSLTISSAQTSSSVYTVPASTNSCSSSVAPGSSCTLSVSFTPTKAQSYPAFLTLISNASMPTSLPLQGMGAVPVISVGTSSVTFASTLIGVASPAVTLNIGNNGQAPLIVNLDATTITPPFAFTSWGCSSPILGYPCQLSLTFTPQSAGNFTGTLSIASNDPVTPVYTVALSGTGFSAYPVATITGIGPQTVAVGSTGFGGSGIVLSVYGQNFFPNSVITVNGEALTTTYQDATFLYATLDPALLGSMAELPVTVTNAAPGGGVSASVLLTTYLSVPMQLSAMVYEPYSRTIFASIPSAAASNPNTVLPINPQTGALGAPIAVDQNPGAVAVSDDGQYLYVASNGQNAIQRINLTSLAVERTFALPVDSTWGTLQAKELAVVPGSPQTVVATLIVPGVDPGDDGMAAFNDAGLINWIPGVNAHPVDLMVDSFAFAGSPPVIYALPGDAYGFFQEITLGSNGLQYTPPTSSPGGTTSVSGNLVASDGTLLYTNSGQIWNPSSQTQVGTYNPAPQWTQSVVPDDSLGRTFFLDTLSSCLTASGGVCAYDQTSLNQTGSLAFSAVFPPELAGLVCWGNNGFAMFASNNPSTTSSNQFITFRSSIALPSTSSNPAPQLTSLGPSIVTPGGPNFLLGVTGSNFVRGAEVDWNGTARTTTFQSATQLTAYISYADIASAGTAQITVVNPAPGGGTSSSLTVFIGSANQLVINPTALSFGAQPVGQSSAPSAITITNPSNATLEISGISTSGDFAQTNTCGTSLAAGASCAINVIFTPTVPGPRSGTLTITDNNGTQTASLTGTALGGPLTASPTGLTFNTVPYNTTSAPQTVTLTNTGSTPLAVTGIAVTGDFAQTNTCSSTPVPANGTCSISVTYTPSSGPSSKGTLKIQSYASNSPNVVTLTGTEGAAFISVGFGLWLGTQLVGVPSAPAPLNVTNVGNLPLIITSITTSSQFSETDNCSSTLAPLASCTVNVTFTPAAAGQVTGTLTFASNSSYSPTVNLYGTGITSYSAPYVLELTPANAMEGSAAFTLTVIGDYFGPQSVVNWNGSSRTTTFVDGGQLTAAISASDLTTPGTPLVTVVNPAPGGTSQYSVAFDVINPNRSLSFNQTDFAVGNGPEGMVTADFNGDGKPDLAVVNYVDGTVSILLGNGDGTFKTQVTYPTGPTGVAPIAVVTGDFNGDGKLDLAVLNNGCPPLGGECEGGGSIAVLPGNGDGTFGTPIFTYSPDYILNTLAAGDFNGDGKLDLAVGASDFGGVVIAYLGNGDGTFQATAVYDTGGEFAEPPASILIADFNGDGKPDLAVANGYGASDISILLGNGDGTFASPVAYTTGLSPFSIGAADLNGDGKLDLVVANGDPSANSISVLLGNGDGTFQAHVDYPTGVGAGSVALGDFNGDKKLDVTVSDDYSETVSILLGNGDGTFQPNMDFVVGAAVGSVVVNDFNGDGRLDLAVVNWDQNAVSVLLQEGPKASLTPSTLGFAGQLVGSTSSAQPVSLANSGFLAMTISSIAVSGDFAQTNTCGTSLAAGANCTISVTFVPTASGNRTGMLTITDNAPGSPHTMSLAGTGQDFNLAVASGSSSTATVTPGQTATYSLALSGLGGLTQSVSFSCTGAPSEATCSVSPSPAVPASSGSVAITVTVTTTAPSFTAPQAQRRPPSLPEPLCFLEPAARAPFGVALILGLAALLLQMARKSPIPRRKEFFVRLLIALFAALTLLLLSCGGGGGGGGGNSNPGTPEGSSTLTVTGTVSGSAALKHSVTVTLQVD